ncbi:hypothetical protein C8R48DRAFT_717846 [Suillus tomentosus]|nr:hypothetical protein C8R48DRAFT_717846 [Suillus tomentosus]
MVIDTLSLLVVLAVCSTNLAYPVSRTDVEGAVTNDEFILIDVGLVCRNIDGKGVGTPQTLVRGASQWSTIIPMSNTILVNSI